MNLPTKDQVSAFGRHVGTSAASILGTLAMLKIISGGDAQNLQTSLDQISHSVAEFIAAATSIAVTVSGIYAALSANPVVQLLKGLLNAPKSKVAQAMAAAPVEQQAAVVAAANEVPAVKGVPLSDTQAGKTIAALVPAPEVAVVK